MCQSGVHGSQHIRVARHAVAGRGDDTQPRQPAGKGQRAGQLRCVAHHANHVGVRQQCINRAVVRVADRSRILRAGLHTLKIRPFQVNAQYLRSGLRTGHPLACKLQAGHQIGDRRSGCGRQQRGDAATGVLGRNGTERPGSRFVERVA